MPAARKDPKPAAARTPARAATINDIARLAGVSKKTVSRIINRSPLVRQDTREKVEALMREVGYSPDPMARGLGPSELSFEASFDRGQRKTILQQTEDRARNPAGGVEHATSAVFPVRHGAYFRRRSAPSSRR